MIPAITTTTHINGLIETYNGSALDVFRQSEYPWFHMIECVLNHLIEGEFESRDLERGSVASMTLLGMLDDLDENTEHFRRKFRDNFCIYCSMAEFIIQAVNQHDETFTILPLDDSYYHRPGYEMGVTYNKRLSADVVDMGVTYKKRLSADVVDMGVAYKKRLSADKRQRDMSTDFDMGVQ
jgi:hypothetical protein